MTPARLAQKKQPASLKIPSDFSCFFGGFHKFTAEKMTRVLQIQAGLVNKLGLGHTHDQLS